MTTFDEVHARFLNTPVTDASSNNRQMGACENGLQHEVEARKRRSENKIIIY